MPLGRRQRKLLKNLGLVVAGVVLFCVALPLWLPWVLRPLARSQGVQYAGYHREGYGRFRLSGVSLTNGSTRIHIERLEAVVPSVWIWRNLIARQPAGQLAYFSASDWQIESVTRPQPQPSGASSPGPAASVDSEFRNVAGIIKTLNRWIPVAELDRGTIQLSGRTIIVPTLIWRSGDLQAQLELPRGNSQTTKAATGNASGARVAPRQGQAGILRASLGKEPPYRLQIHSDSLHLDCDVHLDVSAAGVALQSTNLWWSNRVNLDAHFARNGLWPETASLQAPDFHLPAELARLPQYRQIDGSLAASWQHAQFKLELGARALPNEVQTNVSPAQLILHARGDTNSAVIETATLISPGFKAVLSRELTLHFDGQLLREPATLKIAVNLTQQPWIPLQGDLSGEADFYPGAGNLPAASFRLSGSNIGDHSLQTQSLLLQGRLDWPWLEISESEASMADGSAIAVQGRMELEKSTVDGGKIRVKGPLARRWLPTGMAYENLSLAVDCAGPLKQMRHSGKLEVTNFTTAYSQPLRIQAEWEGRQSEVQRMDLGVFAGNSSLRMTGAVSLQTNTIDVHLGALTLRTNGQVAMQLAEPWQLSASRSRSGKFGHISATAMDWVGPGGELHAQAALDWPRVGNLRLSLQGLSTPLVADFFKTNLPHVEVRKLQAAASWTNGPASFDLELSATGRANDNLGLSIPASYGFELRLGGHQNGLALSNLVVSTQSSTIAEARGYLPLTVNPANPTNFVHLATAQPLQLSVTTRPEAFFWNTLADLTGTVLGAPDLRINLSGTWQAPQGEIDLRAQALRLSKANPAMPLLENLQLTLQIDLERARLVQGGLLVQGQHVNLTGEIPLGKDFWPMLIRLKLPDVKKASARLRIPEAQLAAFEPLFPTLLAPQGELELDLSLSPGLKLAGRLDLRHARTRPLAELGPIRDINVQMRFQEQALKLESVTANVGGAPLEIRGQAELRGGEWLKGTLPPFSITINGTNVPLSRQPESILRSDLLLAVTKTNGAPPLISGAAFLRDSYYLSDLRALIPGKIAGPSQRPPYFSIDDPAVADWRLAIDVQGERFLKVRSPLLNGVISANLKLQGTLEDPIALGDLKIDSGTVRFPFANLEIQNGLVTLSSQDPYHPELTLTAASKQYGYDIRMQVSGTVDDPVIQFSSTPPLSSEQILLMVTAGQLPQGSFTLTPQQRAQTLAMFLGGDLLAKLGFGDQTKDRLTIRSGQEISEHGRPTYEVEYKLNDRWSLVGDYDRFGDYNAGVKWRILSK